MGAMSDDPNETEKPLRYVPGLVTADLDGSRAPARFYYGDDEEPPVHGADEVINDSTHTRWIEADGVVGIRRGAAAFVGASRAYAAKYDEIDWN